MRDPLRITIECTLTEPDKLRDIYAMLQDEGVLILPDEQDKYYYGILTVSTPKNIILYYNRLTFTMTAEPYAYAVDNEEIDCPLTPISYYQYSIVNSAGTAPAEPAYTVKVVNNVTSFDLWTEHNDRKVAGCRFEGITGGESYTVDVKNRIVYDHNGNVVIDKALQDFTKIVLLPGQNSICVSNAETLIVKKNERWY